VTNILEKYPPLYQCEGCGKAATVTPQGIGNEPIIKKHCKCPLNSENGIIARRKVTLRGDSQFSAGISKKMQIKITLTLRQFLSAITGRSI